MYGQRDDMHVRADWDRAPPTVYIDLPRDAGPSDLSFNVTTRDELYLACDDAVDILDAPLRADGGGHAERVPLPREIADRPERYTATVQYNNVVVTLSFQED